MGKINETVTYGAISSRNVVVADRYSDSNSAPRLPNGKLDLSKPNAYRYHRHQLQNQHSDTGPYDVFLPPKGQALSMKDFPSYNNLVQSLNNEVYSRWNGKLRKGDASLGVTLASWGQTSAMITQRSNSFATKLDNAYEFFKGNRSARKRIMAEREPLAGLILEHFFGWTPLIVDIRAAALSVVQKGLPDEWVSASGVRSINEKYVVTNNSWGHDIRTCEGLVKLKYSASVRVSNPNLWLANRAGLIDLPSVAWDLVPWSFVVNFVSNAATIIGSFSHRAGLSVGNESMMLKTSGWVTESNTVIPFESSSDYTWFSVTKDRTLNVRPSLSFELHRPKFTWSTAAIAASLVVQKVSRLNKLLRLI